MSFSLDRHLVDFGRLFQALEVNQDESMPPPTPNTATVALGAAQSDLRRDARMGRGQRKRTEDPEFIPPQSVVAAASRPGRPPKRQRLDD